MISEYRKTILIFLFVIVGLLFLLWLLMFNTKMGYVIYHIMHIWAKEGDNFSRLQLLGIWIVSILSVIFGVMGYRISSHKGRDNVLWTILCVLFNFWAFLLLISLPSKRKEKK